MGPFFIVLGNARLRLALPWRIHIQMLGKAARYFGFIFFGLILWALRSSRWRKPPFSKTWFDGLACHSRE